MFGKTASCGAFVGIVTLVLTVMLPWSVWGAPGPQTLMVEKLAAIESCPIMSDSELNSMRGRYDGYFFGLDINVNLCGGPLFSLGVDPRSTGYTNGDLNVSDKGISYNKGPVNYQAGVGMSNVFQTVQVNGTGIPLTGLVNLNITVPQSLQTLGRTGGLSLPKPAGPFN
jgi:hypothetical protein